MSEETCTYETPPSMVDALNEFTSTSSKLAWHRDIIDGLHAGRGVPKVSGIFITDVCQHRCAFCSTANRGKDALTLTQIKRYLDQLVPLGLKAVILSGGGNPILWKCRESGADFNQLVWWLKEIYHLEIGLITNGMPMKTWEVWDGPTYEDDWSCKYPHPVTGELTPMQRCNNCGWADGHDGHCLDKWNNSGRTSWKNVMPVTLDRLTWIRISLSAWDHGEEVQVPDINPERTTLGASWVYHDRIKEPLDRHGFVSAPHHVKTPIEPGTEGERIQYGKDRLDFVKEKMRELLNLHPFTYIRTLPDCYHVDKIPERCSELNQFAVDVDPRVITQFKPPAPHTCCYLGYVHPVLWPSGEVTPCDSVTLLDESNRSQGGSAYVIGHWDDIGKLYEQPIHSLIDPMVHCKKCVFGTNNRALDAIVQGADPKPEGERPLHANFI